MWEGGSEQKCTVAKTVEIKELEWVKR